MRRTVRHLAWLIATATAVQAWCVAHTATTALDSVRFVELARKMADQGWLPTVRAEAEYPLFPTLIWLAHQGLQTVCGAQPDHWAASATWAATVPLVLAVVPVYLLLRRLVCARGGLAGGLLFCTLPRIASLGADGLSDSSHLLLAVTGMWAMVESLIRMENRKPPFAWITLAGLAIGLAATTRIEAPVLLLCLALTCAWSQSRPASRRPWHAWWQAAAALTIGLGLALLPYLLAAGTVTPRAALARLICRGDQRPAVAGPQFEGRSLPDGTVMSFGPFERGFSEHLPGLRAALVRYAVQLARVLQLAAGLLLISGLFFSRQRPAGLPQQFAWSVFVTVSVAAILYGSRVGYLAPRHLLLAVVIALAPAGWAAVRLGQIAGQRWRWTTQPGQTRRQHFGMLRWSVVTVAMLATLLVTLRPLHGSREPHRRAAAWLAQNGSPTDVVLDTLGLSGLYSGLSTRDYYAAERTFIDPHLAFVVLERREMLLDTPRGVTLRRLLELSGERVARFSAPASKSELDVLVYRWSPDRFARLIEPAQSAGL